MIMGEHESTKQQSKKIIINRYFKDHWSYLKCVDTFKAMIYDEKKQFICGFPYQLSIEEGLLDPESVADEMSESD